MKQFNGKKGGFGGPRKEGTRFDRPRQFGGNDYQSAPRPSAGYAPRRESSGGAGGYGKPRGFGGDAKMFDATCSQCGDACQVPFRPVSGKPVLCKSCFVPNDRFAGNDRSSGNDRFAPRNDYKQKSFEAPARTIGSAGSSVGMVIKQLEALNNKLDRLIRTLEKQSSGATATAEIDVESVLSELAQVEPTEKSAKKKSKKVDTVGAQIAADKPKAKAGKKPSKK